MGNSLDADRFKCQCGCGRDVMDSVKVAMARLEERLHRKLTVTSGSRCAARNASIKNAAKSSLHMAGLAVDIATKDEADQDSIIAAASLCGFRGIGKGYGGKFVHLDLGYIRQWTYDANGRAIYAARH